MTGMEERIVEADLVAYADGMMDPARVPAVEAHLAADPADAEKIAAWRRQNEALRALYGRVALEPVPERLSVMGILRRQRRARLEFYRMAAVVLVCLTLGGLAGWQARSLTDGGPAQSLVDDATRAHALYTVEKAHPVEVASDREAHLVTWLSRRLDRALVVPDLASTGFHLVGGRLLPGPEGPAAQIMYENADGTRLTLYVVPSKAAEETELQAFASGPLAAYGWTSSSVECVFVGPASVPGLRSVAETAYEQIDKAA